MNKVENVFSAPVPSSAMVEVEQSRAVAETQAQILMAIKFPRDEKRAVDRIINACTRPTLAENSVYSYSKGGSSVSGASIRLAEAIAQNWGNLQCGVIELSRANGHSDCMAYAIDLETNFKDEKRFQVKHWRDTKSGGYAIKDEREIYELVANMGARRKRACILAVIPGDVVDMAVRQCEVTLNAKADTSPEGIKKLLDAFAEFDVTKQQIEKRIQRNIESITAAQIVSLKKVYASLRDGMSFVGDWFEGATDSKGTAAVDLEPILEEIALITDEKLLTVKRAEWLKTATSAKNKPAIDAINEACMNRIAELKAA